MNYIQIMRTLMKDSTIARFERVVDEGQLTSVIAYRRSGSYDRIELLPEYFRKKQEEHHEKIKEQGDDFVPEESYWKLFVAIVDLFQENNIHLVVNEINEAPYVTKMRPSAREFMRNKVRPYVESRGIPYIRAPLEQLGNNDFFDYNHLNHNGGRKYARMLAKELKPYLAKKEK